MHSVEERLFRKVSDSSLGASKCTYKFFAWLLHHWVNFFQEYSIFTRSMAE